MSLFNQVTGGNCRLAMYRETAPGIIDESDDGVVLSMLSETTSVSPSKQNSAIISGKRGAGKPFEGNPEYSGGVKLASYAPLLGHVLRALCGAPVTTMETDIELDGAVTDEGDGYVGLPCMGNAFVQDTVITVEGTTNYDGTYRVEYGTENTKIVIKSFYKAETLAMATAKRGRTSEAFYKHEFKLPMKQPTVSIEKYLDFDSGAAENPYVLFSFCKVNGIAFSFGGGDEVSFDIDFSVGSGEYKPAPVKSTEPDLLPALPFMDKEFALWIDGERVGDIQSGSVDMQFGIEAGMAVGDMGKRTRQPEGDPVCTATLTAFLEHDEYTNLAQNATTVPFALSCSGSQGEEFRVNFSESELNASGVQISGKTGLTQEITVTSFVDQGDAAVTYTLVNRVVSYA